jgi:Na+-transporting methylmalonyl-CoA/oxaloacetate decarboxylase gamma subunit
MTQNLFLSLQVTLVGMGIVFLAIILLWGLMTLLTALTQRTENESDTPQTIPVSSSGLKARAAAIAVAAALAEQSQQTAQPLSTPPTTIVSAWQLGMRTRQMHEKGGRLSE